MTLKRRDALTGLLLVLPALLIILGITLQPILTTFYLSFFNASLSKLAANVYTGSGKLRQAAQRPGFLGHHPAHFVFHHCLSWVGAVVRVGDCPADPIQAAWLEVPARQPDHPLGGADYRQRHHVALDL